MQKKIILIVYIASFLGLFSELLAVFSFPQEVAPAIIGIKGWLSCMHLTFLGIGLFNYTNFDTSISINYLDLAIYLVMLTGVILFQVTKQKETRLLRFSMMVVFISNSVILVTSCVTPFYYLEYIKNKPAFWISWLLAKVVILMWIYLSYKGLKYIESIKSREIEFGTDDVGSRIPVNIASKTQRFFHLVMDLYICIFLLSPFANILGPKFLEFMETHFGERGSIYIFAFVFRLIYYPFCEIILGATPAKLLTETFVVDYAGNKPDTGRIFLRTFARFIPFEAFSFFGRNGWHDYVTQTHVCREARTGVKGRWYFLVFPAFLLIGLGSYFGHEWYQDYQSRQYSIKEHRNKIEAIENGLKHLTNEDVIQIEDVNNRYSSEELYLKVEEIDHDELLVAVLEKHGDYSHSLYALEKIYNLNKNYLSTIPVKLSDLKKAYTLD